MTEFTIIAEGHEGAFSIPEEILGKVLAENRYEAMHAFSCGNNGVTFHRPWGCWICDGGRHVVAVDVESGETFGSEIARVIKENIDRLRKANMAAVEACEKLARGVEADSRMSEKFGPDWRSHLGVLR